MKKLALVFCTFTCLFSVHSFGQTSFVFGFHTGSYMDKVTTESEYSSNVSFAFETTLINNISISLGYRRLFYLFGTDDIYQKQLSNSSDYNIYGLDTYTGNGIDFESKYFFNNTEDDGCYFGSIISYQVMNAKVDIPYVEYLNPNLPGIPVQPGAFTDNFTILPLTFKFGWRLGGETVWWDLYFGYSFNIGSGKVESRRYSKYINYDNPSANTFIIGCKLGFTLF
ncbi:MAG TPA: hypothetical protein VK590_01440 [Saprospiraceae bacterium]|nr:hypothetical protein [Saprospiraceae bacterium]